MNFRSLIAASAAVASVTTLALAAHAQTGQPLSNPVPSTLSAPATSSRAMSGASGPAMTAETRTMTGTATGATAGKPDTRLSTVPLSANPKP